MKPSIGSNSWRTFSEGVIHMFLKIVFLKKIVNFKGKRTCGSSLSMLEAWKHFPEGLFLWNLRKFQEHLFSQNTFIGCFKSIHPEVFYKRSVLRKKRLWHGCFPVKSAKFLRTSFFKEHLVVPSAASTFLKI